jgi:hypothetical protein
MFIGTLVKSNSKLSYSNGKDKLLYDQFIAKIKDGEEVEIFVCLKGRGTSPAQISKVHACIREIAGELGFPFDDMKLIIKEKAGLCYEVEDEGERKIVCKSFADCSLLEITLAIEACKDVARQNDIILE